LERFVAPENPTRVEEIRQTRSVIGVQVCQEHGLDAAKRQMSADKPLRDTSSDVNNKDPFVDDDSCRRTCTHRVRTGITCPQQDDLYLWLGSKGKYNEQKRNRKTEDHVVARGYVGVSGASFAKLRQHTEERGENQAGSEKLPNSERDE